MSNEEQARQIRERYQSDPRSTSFNAVVYGGLGTGKTYSVRTAVAPILVHSFDPGGSKVLANKIANHPYPNTCIDSGAILVDSRFEVEDPKKPTAFALWDKEYENLKRSGFFDSIGTFVIDSMTTWAQCALNEVLKRAGRAGGVPQQNDWFPQMVALENAIRDFISLPCNCILIGHDAATKDEVTGKIYKDLMITGKLTRRIPLLFDEIYYATTKHTSKGTEYFFATKATSTYQARSRLSASGQLDEMAEPNYKKILRKVGLSAEDKPAI